MPKIRKKTTKKKPTVYVASCGSGLEPLVAEEIASYGGHEVTLTPGAVSWTGPIQTAYKACLHSRFSSRILLELSRFQAPDTDTLYDEIGHVMWDEHFSLKTTFAVYTTLVHARINHSQFASLRVKDAIVDQFQRRLGRRPDVDTYKPKIRFNLHIHDTRASISLDLSGESLHRRGYRSATGEAPLKETLAAALVKLSAIPDCIGPDDYLLDPMCGSGTLLIEAALMLNNSAPGLLRDNFGFHYWLKHRQDIWDKVVNEALEAEGSGSADSLPHIIGYDADPRAVAVARKNVIAAGMREIITIRHRPLARLNCPGRKGVLLTNPPYGERLSEKNVIKYLYRFLGRRFHDQFTGWQLAFFTGNPDLAEMTGTKWYGQHALYNGPIRCKLFLGNHTEKHKAPPLSRSLPEKAAILSDCPAPEFANRLFKNCSNLLPWAEDNDVECFRLYDRDMPEYNMAIDLYGHHVHVQEYAPPKTIDPHKAEERFSAAVQTLRLLLELPRSQLFIKTRKRQKGSDQYQKKENKKKQKKHPRKKNKGISYHEVCEGGYSFLVNFTDYLDTGLFLDHRITRSKIAELAQGKTFLNLFGYTGSATVYAAAGGATSTTTVDISARYLERAQMNLAINGHGGPLHTFVEADCMQWLRTSRSYYGCIFVDPPTFSNARHRKTSFAVNRDHKELLQFAMNRLAPNGTLIFSTNSRKFKFDMDLAASCLVQEITRQTIPFDFSASPPIHRCWLLRHKKEAASIKY